MSKKETETTLKRLIKSRTFWLGSAAVVSAGLMFYDWYRDRYALPSTRYSRIAPDYQIPLSKLHKIRSAFVKDMFIGLRESNSTPQKERKSSLKMLHTKIHSVPTGDENGVFYTLDWGGSNYRVLRIEFPDEKHKKPITHEVKHKIETKFKKAANANALFDHLAEHLSTQIGAHQKLNANIPKNKKFNVGFTFSFPMTQPELNKGILLEWTKGFDIPGVVGQDVVELMHNAFDRQGINAEINAVCNDTVGTLLACAYDYENVRVGLILGTGTNAAYIEPNPFDSDEKYPHKEELINIEWGGFDKLLPRMPTDLTMDEYVPNPGVQFAEKMISGYYLGELVRLLSLEVFRDSITNYADASPLNKQWQFGSETVSAVLNAYYASNLNEVLNICQGPKCNLKNFNESDARVFAQICQLIVNRSADLASTLLLGTLQKTGLFHCKREDENNHFEKNDFELTDVYKKNESKTLVVGIDGSVFQYAPRYKERMHQCMVNMVGEDIASRVRLVHSSDGSGKGAALAVAATLETTTEA